MKLSDRGWSNLPQMSRELFKETYLKPGETYDQWVHKIATKYSNNESHAERISTYIHNYWMMPSTPVSTDKGLPIACYVSEVPDNREGIFDAFKEGMWLGAEGGGRGVDWSLVRGAGAPITKMNSPSSGVIPLLGISDRATYGVSQAGTRRSTETAYLDISHPDILDFLDIRLETGDKNRRMPNLHHSVVITDDFMEAVENLDTWDLICPKTGNVVNTVDAFDLFMAILIIRKSEAGEPNIMFKDTANRYAPMEYKKDNVTIKMSNICTEIFLKTDAETTGVCCLASLNVEHWAEFKDDIDQVVADVSDFLDNVLQYTLDTIDTFSEDRKHSFRRVYKAIQDERSIGIGVMGFHSLLQSSMIPFSAPTAKGLNISVFRAIKEASDKHQLALNNPCPMAKRVGSHRRNINDTAVAPTMSIATLAGICSSGIEPWKSNTFVKKIPAGSFTIRNKYLVKVMKNQPEYTPEWEEAQWSIINKSMGSVQSLDWMDDYTKDVFKTALEIDQRALISLAGDRMGFISQGQSLNLFLGAETSYEELYAIHMMAWKAEVKSLYYLRSSSEVEASVSQEGRQMIVLEDDVCVACT